MNKSPLYSISGLLSGVALPRRGLRQRARVGVCVVICLMVCAIARAEREEELLGKLREQLGEMPARGVLGVRVRSLEQATGNAPVVVIAPDAAAYAAQVGGWSVKVRYPVLIDDGTDAARENIARFVRGYRPERVVLAPGGSGQGVRAMVEDAAAGAWGATDMEGLEAVWERAGFVPAGAVVVSERDPAWTGGLALAAARGQVLIWSGTTRGRAGDVIKDDDLGALRVAVARGLESSGYSWRGLGDAIDSVTLCLTRPSRVAIKGEKGHLALTDVIGRHADGGRFAWCGMVHGDAQWSAYRAMCAVFLDVEDAWLFDGYPKGFAEPFELDGMRGVLEASGLGVVHDSGESGTVDGWRGRCMGGVDAGLIHVNTKGHNTWFELVRGRAYGSDVPELERPSVVHFIHSFSAQNVNPNQTIGARWLEMGAYAYAGSVHEPYLGAFVPGTALAQRLVQQGTPWGAAVRVDGGPVWKINVFGDPLMVIPNAVGEAGADEVVIEGGVDLKDRMSEQLRAWEFDAGMRALVMRGMDDEALRLAKALAGDDEKFVVGAVAGHSLRAAVRAGDDELFLWLYDRTSAETKGHRITRDLLWQVGRRMVSGGRDDGAVALLRGNIRNESADADLAALAGIVSRSGGKAGVAAMYDEVLARKLGVNIRRRVEKDAKRYR